jgi:hypothetical protein
MNSTEVLVRPSNSRAIGSRCDTIERSWSCFGPSPAAQLFRPSPVKSLLGMWESTIPVCHRPRSIPNSSVTAYASISEAHEVSYDFHL